MQFADLKGIAPRMLWTWLKLYRGSQWWDRQRTGNYQDLMLRRLIKHAAVHVPYYRQLFAGQGIDPEKFRGRQDMHRIPVLEKETLRRRRDEFVADNAGEFIPSRHRTSGSTGTPLEFLLDQQARAHDGAAAMRSYAWAGYYPGMKMFSIKDHLKKWEYRYGMAGRVLNFDSNSISADSAKRIWPLINRLRPRVFRSYPFTLLMLYRYGLEAGLKMHKPETIITTGESLPESLRGELKKCYQADVFDYYGMTENTAMITECPEHSYHVIEDYAWHEFLKPGGSEILTSGRGEIVATGFYNYSMPLIRYRCGDFAWLNPETKQCSCGRMFRTVEKIEGRKEDYILTPEGVRLNLIETPLNAGKGIMMGQYVQDALDHMYVNILPGPDFSAESLREVEAELRRLVGSSIKIDFRVVRELEKRPGGETGKVPFILSRIGKSLYE